MFIQIWFLPLALLATATIIAFPLSAYIAWIMDGKYRPLPVFRWFEKSLDSGPQNWMQYTGSLLLFNTILFVYGYIVLALQPYTPLNPDGKTLLSPTTIFHSVSSFMTNTDLQHYAGVGLRHRTLKVEGVQFHPESVLTEGGHQMIQNFLNM